MHHEIGWLVPNTRMERDPAAIFNGKESGQNALISSLGLPESFISGVPNEILERWNSVSPSPIFSQFFYYGKHVIISICFVGPKDKGGRLTHGCLLIRACRDMVSKLCWNEIRNSVSEVPEEVRESAINLINRIEKSDSNDLYVTNFNDLMESLQSCLYRSGSSEKLNKIPVEYRTEFPYKKKAIWMSTETVTRRNRAAITIFLVILLIVLVIIFAQRWA